MALCVRDWIVRRKQICARRAGFMPRFSGGSSGRGSRGISVWVWFWDWVSGALDGFESNWEGSEGCVDGCPDRCEDGVDLFSSQWLLRRIVWPMTL
ncbi:hypothetical protein BJX62DRAFT_210486 [Aspergillus germanicus]